MAALEEDVDLAAGDVDSAAQVPVLAVVKAGLRWLAVAAELSAEEEPEALVDLRSRQSFSAATARSTT